MSSVSNSIGNQFMIPQNTAPVRRSIKEKTNAFIDSSKPPCAKFSKETCAVAAPLVIKAAAVAITAKTVAACPALAPIAVPTIVAGAAALTECAKENMPPMIDSCVDIAGDVAKKVVHKSIDCGVKAKDKAYESSDNCIIL